MRRHGATRQSVHLHGQGVLAASARCSPTRRSVASWPECHARHEARSQARRGRASRAANEKDQGDHRKTVGPLATRFVTAIFTGLRASELRGLKWKDVDT